MSETLSMYPCRVESGIEHDALGLHYFVQISDVDDFKARLQFNDSHDIPLIEKLICKLMDVARALDKQREQEDWEQICSKCPDD